MPVRSDVQVGEYSTQKTFNCLQRTYELVHDPVTQLTLVIVVFSRKSGFQINMITGNQKAQLLIRTTTASAS